MNHAVNRGLESVCVGFVGFLFCLFFLLLLFLKWAGIEEAEIKK